MSDLFAYPPRFMGRSEAARYMGVGITTFDEMVNDGALPRPKRMKTKAVWDRVDLDLAATALPSDSRTVTETMLEHYRNKRR